jgi:hypothetical protein
LSATHRIKHIGKTKIGAGLVSYALLRIFAPDE